MHINKLSAFILTGTLILSCMTSTVKADENIIYTDHHTYYIGNVEYNEDGTVVDASHVCNMHVETPPTTDGNDTDATPDPEEPTEPVTPAPTPVPQPPKEDGSTATDKKEPSIGDITILPDVPDINDGTNDIINTPSEGYISS